MTKLLLFSIRTIRKWLGQLNCNVKNESYIRKLTIIVGLLFRIYKTKGNPCKRLMNNHILHVFLVNNTKLSEDLHLTHKALNNPVQISCIHAPKVLMGVLHKHTINYMQNQTSAYTFESVKLCYLNERGLYYRLNCL